MSVLLEFSMFPTDVGESKSKYVAKSIQIIKDSGLKYTMGSMGTTIEGEWDEVMAVVTDCFNTMKKDCNRVFTGIKIDYRKDSSSGRMIKKIASVESKLETDHS